VLKLSGRGGGTTSGLPTEFQREPSLGSQVPMLVLAARPLARLRASPHLSAATSAVSQPNQPLSATTSRPELVCQPACTPPAGLPSFSRVPRRTGTWRCQRRAGSCGRPGRWGPPFLCPTSAGGRARTPVALQAAHFPVAEVAALPIPDDCEVGVWGLERQARKGDCTVLRGNMELH
jgi:hypothetical protein